ncbi:DUF397 domain-containing protein [Streptomyces diacarni]|uniref:DUF397 domain-containing protein n=1 Tax=Streptomyces tubbatahanensis TaxID=2923272 RepID=A0ABY3XS79_9ACTN|nr:DUF397 domain-containing protein [Streptomyces tubbatahanensis]UNS97292.1 DUF397 domain-containing protein [Streptomyces tubbatahanensis]
MSNAQSTPGTGNLAWFKSSYSGSEGGACLEVAYTWHKSSYSGTEGGNCLEVASCSRGVVHVRDSKNPGGPALALSPAAWARFTTHATTTHP